MELSGHGTIKLGNFRLKFTAGGEWLVTNRGAHVGYVATLTEAEAFIAKYKADVRDRVAKVEAAAAERRAEQQAEACAEARANGSSVQGFDEYGGPWSNCDVLGSQEW
jgi:hypothetical protein